jgi:hypothetical protein
MITKHPVFVDSCYVTNYNFSSYTEVVKAVHTVRLYFNEMHSKAPSW